MADGIVVLKHKITHKFRAIRMPQEYYDHVMAGKGYQSDTLFPEEEVRRLAIPQFLRNDAGYLGRIKREFPGLDVSGLEDALDRN